MYRVGPFAHLSILLLRLAMHFSCIARRNSFMAIVPIAKRGVNMLKPMLEIVNVGQDMWEFRVYISGSITIEHTCNTTALIHLFGAYLATKI